MNNSVKIFVEGIADEEFIRQFLIYELKFNPSKDSIISLQGKDRLKVKDLSKLKQVTQSFVINTEKGGINLLIFDANGNFQNRKNEIDEWKKQLGIEFITFLLPNNSNNGALENLLEKLIPANNSDANRYPQNHQRFIDCFSAYQVCLDADPRYKVPILKTKIYAYLDTLDKADIGIAKEGTRNYFLPGHWDFKSDYLIPLKDFLINHCS